MNEEEDRNALYGAKYKYELGLYEIPDENTVFTILPGYNYQTENERIVYYNEDIHLVDKYANTDNTFYVYVNEDMLKCSIGAGGNNQKVGNGLAMDKYTNMSKGLSVEKSLLMTKDQKEFENISVAVMKYKGQEDPIVCQFQHQNGSKFKFKKYSRRLDDSLIYGGDIVW